MPNLPAQNPLNNAELWKALAPNDKANIMNMVMKDMLNNNNPQPNPQLPVQEEINVMMSAQQIKQLFLKEFLLVFYHPDAFTDIFADYIENLNEICEFRVFADLDEAVECLEKTRSVFSVITSEVNGELFLNKVMVKDNAHSAVVYCQDNNVQVVKQWTKKYAQKVSIEGDFQVIIEVMRKAVTSWERNSSSLRLDFPVFSPIFNDYEMSENYHLSLYLTSLVEYGNRDQGKRDFLTLARVIYQNTSDQKFMDSFEKDYKEYNMASIFNWYTLECFLFTLTNNCLRIAKPDTVYYSRFVLRDLENAIKEQYNLKSHNFSGLLYRAAYFSTDNWDKLKQNQGKEIEMHGFLSTTKSETVREFFAQEHREQKALITIIVPKVPDHQGQGFAEIAEYSTVPEEDEVLFNIRSRFVILQIGSKELNQVEFRHLVLLYGVQEMRQAIRRKNPIIELNLDNLKESRCAICQLQSEDKFVNLEKTTEYVCTHCIKTQDNLKMPALVFVKNNSAANSTLSVEGMLINYTERLKVPFPNCVKCKSTNVKTRFACQVCRTRENAWCEKCFSENGDCCGQNHLIIVETEPISFWSEGINEAETFREDNKKYFKDQGDVLRNTFDLKKAKEYYEKALLQSKEKCDDYNIGFYSKKLGILHNDLAQPQEAVQYYLDALKISEKIFGLKHINSAILFTYLGMAYDLAGQFKEALKWHIGSTQIFQDLMKDMGPNAKPLEHIDLVHHTAVSFQNTGTAFLRLGGMPRAIEVFNTSLSLLRSISREKHPQAVRCYHTLGLAHVELGQFYKGIEYFSHGLRLQKEIFGDKHPETAAFYSSLATTHCRLGRFKEALGYELTALEIRKAIHGDKHVATAVSYNGVGLIYMDLGQLDEAIKFISNAIDIVKLNNAENSVIGVDCYYSAGQLHMKKGELEKALECQLKSLGLTKELHGGSHHRVAASYSNLGIIYKRLTDFNKAEECYLTALKISKEVSKENDPNTANLYVNLARLYDEKKEFDKARENYEKAIQFMEVLHGNIANPTMASTYLYLAIAHNELGNLGDAAGRYFQAFQMSKALYGDLHPQTRTAYTGMVSMAEKLGSEYKASGQLGEAIEGYKSALQMKKNLVGCNHPDIAALCAELGSLYEETSAYEKALECYSEIVSIYQNLNQKEKARQYAWNGLKVAKDMFGDKHPKTELFQNLCVTLDAVLGAVKDQQVKEEAEEAFNKIRP